MVKNVTYARLAQVLSSLGCRPIPSKAGHFVYGIPEQDFVVMLPGGRPDELVRPLDLASVRRSLWGHGFIKAGEDAFDSLFLIRKGDRLIWTDPRTGVEMKVTAAAGESDGLVVVKQNGSLLPCPVDQVRRVKRAATAPGK